jgi:mycothiol synthase
MTGSLRLSVPDLREHALRDAFFGVAAAARERDGADAFNEQSRLDLDAGRRSALVGTVSEGAHAGTIVAAAALGRGELDLVVHPHFRGMGFGAAMLDGILTRTDGEALTAWSHGDHPAAARLGDRFGFAPVRRLLRLVADVPDDVRPDAPAPFTLAPFRPGVDNAEWVALNARIFAAHPEQGALTLDDLRDRMAEDWFDPDDLLLLRDADGRAMGFDWLKIEEGAGEIYVLGVDPASAGQGLGRALLEAGFARLAARGIRQVDLYVEGDNAPALKLYRSAGFADYTADVQYRRETSRSLS